ncbi:MAG TPA: DMT family transporter [Hyphomicrobiaceae bacterium]|nr:DMT family transporter [Hyphomicrobiaceae bacterium]
MISEAPTSPRSGHAALLAALWMAGTLAMISLLAVAGRETMRTLPTMEMIFYRSWMSLPIVVLIALGTGHKLSFVATRRLGMHAWRNAAHLAGQFTWFWAITQIPLAEVFALEFTTPLWVALLAPVILRERMTLPRLAAVMLGFIGALVVIRPTGMAISLGTASALSCAVAYAFSYIAMKQLTRTERPLTILFWLSLFQGIYTTVLTFGSLSWPTLATWGWLLVVSLAGLAAHYCIARAFALADATIVTPMDYLRVPLIALVGWAVYAEALDPFVLIGGAVIAAANIINLLAERRPG